MCLCECVCESACVCLCECVCESACVCVSVSECVCVCVCVRACMCVFGQGKSHLDWFKDGSRSASMPNNQTLAERTGAKCVGTNSGLQTLSMR